MNPTHLLLTFVSSLLAATVVCPAEPDLYAKPNELFVTRGQEVVARLSCERIPLPRERGWPSHHVGGHVGRTRDGRLYAMVSADSTVMQFESNAGGQKWAGREVLLPGLGAFAVLKDDAFLAATSGPHALSIQRSTDRGKTWKIIAQIPARPFDEIIVDSNFLQLKNGTVLLGANLRMRPAVGAPLSEGTYAQYLLRSSDGGQTWEGGGDRRLWKALRESKLTDQDVAIFKQAGFTIETRGSKLAAVDTGPMACWPGVGGTFPGCFETGFRELASGTIVAAFRYSGFPRSWHKTVAKAWGANREPDGHGRIFRHVFLGESADGGKSWKNLRPVVDVEERPFLESGECNGELVEMVDGRLVLIHQRRYPRNASELVARLSTNGGKTWRPDRYHVNLGFGYSSSLVLEDETIVTVTGSSDGGGGQPRGAMIIRWRLAAK